ncbi:U-box domain-containing protein 11-like protein, partial [Tanacetum coccineum]
NGTWGGVPYMDDNRIIDTNYPNHSRESDMPVIPVDLLCPISLELMRDPVIVSFRQKNGTIVDDHGLMNVCLSRLDHRLVMISVLAGHRLLMNFYWSPRIFAGRVALLQIKLGEVVSARETVRKGACCSGIHE